MYYFVCVLEDGEKIKDEIVKHGSLNPDTSKVDELNVTQKGRVIFSWFRIYIWKKVQHEFGKEDLGLTLDIVANGIDLLCHLPKVRAEPLEWHDVALIS